MIDASDKAPVSRQDAEAPAGLSSWLDAIAEITRAANRAVPLGELLDLIAGATARLTGYDFCAVFVEDPAQQCLLIQGSYGLSREYVDTINAQKPIPVRPGDRSEGPSSRAFRSQRPTAVLDITTDAPSRHWEAVAAQQGYFSLLSVPLVVGQAPFGLLNCYTADRHVFSAGEIMLMESMSNQAALAIETTRRLGEAHSRASQLEEAHAEAAARLAALQRADENSDHLLDVVLRGGGLAAIIESLARMLRCSVAVDDAAGRPLAYADSDGRPGSPGAQFSSVHEPGRLLVDSAPDSGVVEIPPAPEFPGDHGGLVVPVVLDEEVVGQLWAVAPDRPFGAQHRQALDRAAAVVALAMLKERTAQEVEWKLSREFLDDLLDAEGQSNEALHARARQLSADLTKPHTVVVIRRDATHRRNGVGEHREAHAQRSLLSLVQQTGAAWQGVSLVATRSDHVVVLWRHDRTTRSAAEFADQLRREIHAYASGWTATICIGPSCDDLIEYGDAYRLACGVLDLVQQSGRGDKVVALDDVGAYRLLLQVKRPRELEAFAQAVLGQMHAYDRRHQTKLGPTLQSFMAQRCNVGLTAKTLHVHANTVTYRLRRIEQLLDVDLRDPQALLHVQLALMIEKILSE